MLNARIGLIVMLAGLLCSAATADAAGRRLEVRNKYSAPEETLRYYLERDAAGFVYSGLLDVERREFTEWSEAPAAESYYVARTYQVSKPLKGSPAGEAAIDVEYDLIRLQDASGGAMPVSKPKRKVRFILRKDSAGHWRIASPAAKDIVPVVIETVASKKALK